MKITLLLIWKLLLAAFTLSSSELIRLPLVKNEIKNHSESKYHTNFKSKKGLDIINYHNFNYFGAIKLGSQKKELKVILDTGSNLLWVRDSTKFGYGYNGFSCSQSSTCKANPSFIETIKYDQGSMIGYKITDQLTLGSLELPDYNLLLATKVEEIDKRIDGILGLSLSQGKDYKNFPSVLDRLKSSGLIESRTFSMYLGDSPKSFGDVTGEIIFGGYDPEYAKGEFKFVQVNGFHWQADLYKMTLGNDSISSSFPVIFDSGTSLLLLPTVVFKNLINNLNLKGGSCFAGGELSYRCSCSKISQLPDLVFHFDKNAFNIPASAYIDNSNRFQSQCDLLVQDIGDGSYEGILGDTFLKNYYALYTVDNKTVGLVSVNPKAGAYGNNDFEIVIILVLVIAIVAAFMYWRNSKRAFSSGNTKQVDLVFEGTQKSRLIKEYEGAL